MFSTPSRHPTHPMHQGLILFTKLILIQNTIITQPRRISTHKANNGSSELKSKEKIKIKKTLPT